VNLLTTAELWRPISNQIDVKKKSE